MLVRETPLPMQPKIFLSQPNTKFSHRWKMYFNSPFKFIIRNIKNDIAQLRGRGVTTFLQPFLYDTIFWGQICMTSFMNGPLMMCLKWNFCSIFRARCRKVSSSFSITSESSMTSGEPGCSGDQKYRRMRDLNNLASRRCRQNRKQKLSTLSTEESREREKNEDLKMKVRLLEEQVKRVKDAILKSIVPGSNPIVAVSNSTDIDDIVRQKAADLL